ncbi:MAG: hypothetical protein ACI9XU_001552 [Arenicella sp.]
MRYQKSTALIKVIVLANQIPIPCVAESPYFFAAAVLLVFIAVLSSMGLQWDLS